jgi:hypothetical protein
MRVIHTSVDMVMRGVITNASFVAIAIIGAALAESKHVLRSVAAGATVALGVLGGSGILVSLGYLPPPSRVTMARTLFGITSPFVRNYGLDVAFDGVALLIPLCVPLFAVTVLYRRERVVHRLVSLLLLAEITFVAWLVFQARGMLVDMGIALILSAWLTGRRTLQALATGTSILLVPIGAYLISSDEISSGLRTGAARAVFEQILANPVSLFVGSNQDLLYARGAELSGVAFAISYEPGANVIHNLFLQNLAGGGFLAFLLVGSAYAVLLYHSVRLWFANKSDLESQVLLVAVVLVIFELNVEPVRANIVGSWLVMGLCLGRQISRSSRVEKLQSSTLGNV